MTLFMSSTWSAVLILIIKPDTSKSSFLSFCLCLPACLSVWLQYAWWLILGGEPNDRTLPSLPDSQRCCVMTKVRLWVWMPGMDCDGSEWLVWIAMGLNDWYGLRWVWIPGMDCDGSECLVWIAMVLNVWYGSIAMGLNAWYGLRWFWMSGMDRLRWF